MKIFKAVLLIQAAVLLSSPKSFAKDGGDEMLAPNAEIETCEYQISPDAEEILNRMHPAAQEKFKKLANMSKGEVFGLLGAAYHAVIEEIIRSVPERYQDEIRAIYMKSPRTHTVTTTLTQEAQDLAVSGYDISHWKNIQPNSKDYLDLDVPAETQSAQVAKQLAIVKELVRVGHDNLAGIQTPSWRRNFFVFMVNPFPDVTVGQYDQARLLAGYEWDLLNLANVGESLVLAQYFEARREVLLKSATQNAQKKKINKVFDEIKLKVELATTLTRDSYINRQGRRSLVATAPATLIMMPARYGMIFMIGNIILAKMGYPSVF